MVVLPCASEFHTLHGSWLHCRLCTILPLWLLQRWKNILLTLTRLGLLLRQIVRHTAEDMRVVRIHLAKLLPRSVEFVLEFRVFALKLAGPGVVGGSCTFLSQAVVVALYPVKISLQASDVLNRCNARQLPNTMTNRGGLQTFGENFPLA